MSRTLIFGDLQGCYDDTIRLMEKCKVTNDDRLIFAGDLVDRGPDSGKCLDLAREREQIQGEAAAVLGNHEEKHLRYRAKEEQGKKIDVHVESHIETRRQLTTEHYAYMRRMPLYIRLPEHNAVVVHAGVFPGRPIEKQKADHLLHIQMIKPFEYDANGNVVSTNEESKWPSKAPEGWKFWTHFWDGPERIIFGHSVLNKPLVTDKVCGIDGGGCFGRQLHALILPSWEIVSIDCPVDYGKGRRGVSTINIAEYTIHGDVFAYS